MKFKVPKKLRIAGVDHQVIESSALAIDEHRRGTATHFFQVITLDTHLLPDEKRRTFLHESIHHIDDLFEIGLKDSQVARLATGMAELIQQLEPDNIKPKRKK